MIALELFVARRVSSLPVVDHSGTLLGLFTKHHIMVKYEELFIVMCEINVCVCIRLIISMHSEEPRTG